MPLPISVAVAAAGHARFSILFSMMPLFTPRFHAADRSLIFHFAFSFCCCPDAAHYVQRCFAFRAVRQPGSRHFPPDVSSDALLMFDETAATPFPRIGRLLHIEMMMIRVRARQRGHYASALLPPYLPGRAVPPYDLPPHC